MPVIAALETISATRLGPCQERITFFQDKPISSNPGAQNAISNNHGERRLLFGGDGPRIALPI